MYPTELSLEIGLALQDVANCQALCKQNIFICLTATAAQIFVTLLCMISILHAWWSVYNTACLVVSL